MRIGVFTDDVELYARLYAVLKGAGFKVGWKEKAELVLGDLGHPFAQVLVWPTPWGVRAYDPLAMAFLTRQDRLSTLPEGLRGRLGLRLSRGERWLLLEWAQGKRPGREDRFFLRGLRNKFGLADEGILRIGRVSLERLRLLEVASQRAQSLLPGVGPVREVRPPLGL